MKIVKPPVKNLSICSESRRSACCSILGNTRELLVGTKQDKNYGSLLQFALPPLPEAALITHSTLHVFIQRNLNPWLTRNLEIFQVLSEWDASNAVRKYKPLINPQKAASEIIKKQQIEFISISITSLVKKWYTNEACNFGILLKLADEGSNDVLIFAGKGTRNSEVWPVLEIEFLEPMPKLEEFCGRILDVKQRVKADKTPAHTEPLNTLLFQYSYIPVNVGHHAAQAFLQTSCDGVHWNTESASKIILPQHSEVFVPDTIGKYSRLVYQALEEGEATTLVVHVQGRCC